MLSSSSTTAQESRGPQKTPPTTVQLQGRRRSILTPLRVRSRPSPNSPGCHSGGKSPAAASSLLKRRPLLRSHVKQQQQENQELAPHQRHWSSESQQSPDPAIGKKLVLLPSESPRRLSLQLSIETRELRRLSLHSKTTQSVESVESAIERHEPIESDALKDSKETNDQAGGDTIDSLGNMLGQLDIQTDDMVRKPRKKTVTKKIPKSITVRSSAPSPKIASDESLDGLEHEKESTEPVLETSLLERPTPATFKVPEVPVTPGRGQSSSLTTLLDAMHITPRSLKETVPSRTPVKYPIHAGKFLSHPVRTLSSWQYVHRTLKKQESVESNTVGSDTISSITSCSSLGDRFIPNGPGGNLSDTLELKRMAQLMKNKNRGNQDQFIDRHSHTITLPVSNIANDEIAEDSEAYTTSVATACGLAFDQRILNFNPSRNEGIKGIEGTRAGYQRPLKPYKAVHLRRKIPTIAERVLDAPGIVDDFYLNVLDWSSRNQLAVGLAESVYIWNATSGSVHELLPANPSPTHPSSTLRTDVSALTWCPDGIHLAIHDSVGQMHIWNVEQSKRVRVIRDFIGHRASSIGWSLHASASLVGSGGSDGSIHLHDVRIRDSLTMDGRGHTGDVCGLRWNQNLSTYIASGGNDNIVNVWDCRNLAPLYRFHEHRAAVKALSWCPWQSHTLLTGGGTDDGQILFWNTANGIRVGSIDTGSQVTGLLWSKHYREFISCHGFPDNQMTLWKYPSLKPVISIPHAHQSRILHMTMSPDGQTVCTGAADENLKFWKLFSVNDSFLKKTRTPVAPGEPERSPDFGCISTMR